MKSPVKFNSIKRSIIAFSVFYAVTGFAEIYILFLSGFRLFPLGFLSVLSIISAYGLVKMKNWCIWFVVLRFFLGTTFAATTLYASIWIQTFNPSFYALSFHLVLIVYLIITLIATIYVLKKRESFH